MPACNNRAQQKCPATTPAVLRARSTAARPQAGSGLMKGTTKHVALTCIQQRAT